MKFKFNDPVHIVEGFYEGQAGYVHDYRCNTLHVSGGSSIKDEAYQILLNANGQLVWIVQDRLEKRTA